MDMINKIALIERQPPDHIKSDTGLSSDITNLVQSQQHEKTPLDLLKVAVEAGLTFADCHDYFAVNSSTNPFAIAAQAIYAQNSDNDVEFDDKVIISRCEYGAFVEARVYVRDYEAGLPEIVELVDLLLQHVNAEEGTEFAQNKPVLHDMVGMLENTFSNFGDMIEELSGNAPDVVPKARFVFADTVVESYTSDVILELVGLGEMSGFNPDYCEAIRNWLEHNGKLLDASLGTVQVP
jgi:hypothetical protein